jgi:ankyrin repeat protein
MVSLLLKAGAHVNVENSKGRTPLYEAARKGGADMISLLKEAGAKE